jgi:type II pantothenate kinase
MKGDASVCDMSVADIYGGAYGSLGLPGNLIASSFGKLKDREEIASLRKQDVARSLTTMISTNAMLQSIHIARKQGIERVVWIGSHIEV